MKKPAKDVSGVAAVAVMTSPYPCPHGKCIYCPGGVAEKSSQSYTGKEPAARRATSYRFDPYDQTFARVKQLEDTGHDASRIDLIIRWGGMRRLSGFLPIQSVYADFYVIDRYWPDSRNLALRDAINWYSRQDVTLGG